MQCIYKTKKQRAEWLCSIGLFVGVLHLRWGSHRGWEWAESLSPLFCLCSYPRHCSLHRHHWVGFAIVRLYLLSLGIACATVGLYLLLLGWVHRHWVVFAFVGLWLLSLGFGFLYLLSLAPTGILGFDSPSLGSVHCHWVVFTMVGGLDSPQLDWVGHHLLSLGWICGRCAEPVIRCCVGDTVLISSNPSPCCGTGIGTG